MAENVEYIIRLRDQYTKNMKRADNASKNFNQTASRIKGTLRNLMPVASVAGGVLIFRQLTKVAMDFEKEMSNVKAISQANRLQFLELENQADSLGKTTAFSAKQSAEGMTFLSMAGFNVTQTMDALPGTLDLAAAGSIDLGRAADIASNVLTQFNLQAAEMNRVNDVIVKTTTRANTNIEQLAEGLKFTGTTAKILKIPLEETSAALGVLANAGLQGSMGGTSLNFALLEMSRISSPTAKKLKDLGVQTHDATGQFVGLTNILEQFEKLGIQSTTILDTFGARGGRAMGTLVEAGSDAIKTLTKMNEESQGIAKTVADMKLDNLAGDMTILKSASQGFAISLGKRMNPAMRESVQLTTNIVRAMEEWVRVPLSQELRKEKLELNAQFNVIKKGNVPVEIRKRLITEINTEYKDYLPNLLDEKSSLQDIETAQKAVNDELRKRIEIEAKKELLTEAQESFFKTQKKLLQAEVELEERRQQNRRALEQGNTQVIRNNMEVIRSLEGSVLPRLRKAYEKEFQELQRLEENLNIPTLQGEALKNANVEGSAKTSVSAEPSDDLKQTITSAAPKVFNINITKLIETQEINTTTLKESSTQIKKQMIEALLEGLNETQTMIAR